MPIHLPPISRRQFLAGTLAAGAGLLPRRLAAESQEASDSFVLLADPHICQERDREHSDVKPVAAFEQVGRDILALEARPAGAIVAGDCAFNHGMPGDYEMLSQLVSPLREGAIPCTLRSATMTTASISCRRFPTRHPPPLLPNRRRSSCPCCQRGMQTGSCWIRSIRRT